MHVMPHFINAKKNHNIKVNSDETRSTPQQKTKKKMRPINENYDGFCYIYDKNGQFLPFYFEYNLLNRT